MPLVRIALHASVPAETRRKIADAMYTALREALDIPQGDRFILISAHEEGDWFIDPNFPATERSNQFVLTHITLSRGRTVEKKQALYTCIASRLHEAAGIAPDDGMTVLTECNLEDWSFAHGEAHYVLNPPAWARKTEEGN